MSICARIRPLTESWDSDTKIQTKMQFSQHFFYSNLCHVCHSHDRESPLKKCGDCKMIYYCSREHQKAHWPMHKNFCKNISTLKHIADNPSAYSGQQDQFVERKIDTKANLIDSVEMLMKKKLEQYENEIIVYPKTCEVCLEEDQNLLKTCPRCPHASFCKFHENDPVHEKFCSLYLSCYVLDYYAIIFQDLPIPRMMEFAPRNSETANMPNSMQKYMDIFFKPRDESKLKMPPEDVKMYVSQHFTRPMTLIYAMKKIEFEPRLDELIIHVIGASEREENSFIEWEILFHWLPKLMKLKVVLVGPELSSCNLFFKKKESSLCDQCSSKGKAVQIQIHNMLYIEYCDGKDFEKPDIIVGFNLGIIAYHSWKNSILQVSKLNSPFVLTAFSEREANDDHKMMQKKFNTIANVEKNPFASLRPKRSPIGDKIFFENTFLIVYTDLGLDDCISIEKEVNDEDLNHKVFDGSTSAKEKEEKII